MKPNQLKVRKVTDRNFATFFDAPLQPGEVFLSSEAVMGSDIVRIAKQMKYAAVVELHSKDQGYISGSWACWMVASVMYCGYLIVPKRDFPLESKQTGFVVTDGMCNIMPGGCWFATVEEAKQAIDVLKSVNGNADRFWEIIQPFGYKLGQKVSDLDSVVVQGRFKAVIANGIVVKLVTKNLDGTVTTETLDEADAKPAAKTTTLNLGYMTKQGADKVYGALNDKTFMKFRVNRGVSPSGVAVTVETDYDDTLKEIAEFALHCLAEDISA